MKLSRRSHQIYEKFFREYFRDERLKLPEIKIYSHGAAKILVKLLAVDGITFGRHILISQKNIKRRANGRFFISKELLAHELAHTMQYQREGFFGFLYNYVKVYARGLRRRGKYNFAARMNSYLEIPQEIEARDCAAAFMRMAGK